jgi:hypothetical protein
LRDRFQRLWNNAQAIWKAIAVLPVPVASVSRMRCLPAAIASSAFSMALWQLPACVEAVKRKHPVRAAVERGELDGRGYIAAERLA